MTMETSDYASEKRHYAGLTQVGQAASKQYLDTPPSVTVPAITDAHQTFEEARILSQRVKDLVGRLVGYAPEDPNKSALASDALFDELKSRSVDTRQAIGEAMSALARLERQLP